jgi:hypothetical protein
VYSERQVLTREAFILVLALPVSDHVNDEARGDGGRNDEM